MPGGLPEALAQIVGARHVLAGDEQTAPYTTDWRRQFRGRALCVARPASTAEVAAVVRACAAADVAIVPQGGNTGLVGGSVPAGERPQIVLSLGRMNRIRRLDAGNDTITAEAGCVLADGTVWDGLRALRKDNTGYDLKQLFIGAEGTLGVITAAVLRLHPKPTASATAWIAVADAARAVALLGHLRGACGDRITAFELLSRRCVEAVLAHRAGTRHPLPAPAEWFVLAQLDDTGAQGALQELCETSVAAAIDQGIAEDAVIAKNGSEAKALWAIRETVPEAQFSNVKHDISVAVSQVPELIERAGAGLERAFPGAPVYCFGHVGDGNLHYNVGNARLLERREAVNRVVYEAVDALGGSISAEHGLGQLKRAEIARHKPAAELELMRAVKRALDPRNLMNPGKVL